MTTTTDITIGTYVQAYDCGAWEEGIVRDISNDGRIVFVQIVGEEDLMRRRRNPDLNPSRRKGFQLGPVSIPGCIQHMTDAQLVEFAHNTRTFTDQEN